jgi:hypothetical protein
MPPRRSARKPRKETNAAKQQRHDDQKLRRGIGNLNVAENSEAGPAGNEQPVNDPLTNDPPPASSTATNKPSNDEPSAEDSSNDSSSDQDPPPPPDTTISISQFHIANTWEEIEEEERKKPELSRTYMAGSVALFRDTRYLPVQIHIAAPQTKRFTREIEYDIMECNTIDAVTDIAKRGLALEMGRSNMPTNVKFAGLMTYGPTKNFTEKTITRNVVRGLFLDPAAYKKWWISVDKYPQTGVMIKIAVVLFDVDEAANYKNTFPDFWNDNTARILNTLLNGVEWHVWNFNIEQGGRSYEAMQAQVQQARLLASQAMGPGLTEERKVLISKLAKETQANKKLEKESAAMEKKLIASEKKSTVLQGTNKDLNKHVNDAREKEIAMMQAVDDEDWDTVKELVAGWRRESKGKRKVDDVSKGDEQETEDMYGGDSSGDADYEE